MWGWGPQANLLETFERLDDLDDTSFLALLYIGLNNPDISTRFA
jgi:hypothetical protein